MKNFSKKSKLISLILAICVLLSSVFSITAFGAEVDENVSIPLLVFTRVGIFSSLINFSWMIKLLPKFLIIKSFNC